MVQCNTARVSRGLPCIDTPTCHIITPAWTLTPTKHVTTQHWAPHRGARVQRDKTMSLGASHQLTRSFACSLIPSGSRQGHRPPSRNVAWQCPDIPAHSFVVLTCAPKNPMEKSLYITGDNVTHSPSPRRCQGQAIHAWGVTV